MHASSNHIDLFFFSCRYPHLIPVVFFFIFVAPGGGGGEGGGGGGGRGGGGENTVLVGTPLPVQLY